MKFLLPLLFPVALLAEETEVEKALTELRTAVAGHSGYIATYEGSNENGKSVELDFALHVESKQGGVWFTIKSGEESSTMATISSGGDQLGISPDSTIRVEKCFEAFEALARVFSLLGEGKLPETHQIVPNIQAVIGRKDIDCGLTVGRRGNLPWLPEKGLAAGTECLYEDDAILFKDPENGNLRVEAATGLLLDAEIPVPGGKRILTRKHLQLNPAEDEVKALLDSIPRSEEGETISFAESPQMMQTNLLFARLLVLAVERGSLSTEKLRENFRLAESEMGTYFTLLMPECHELVLPAKQWKAAFEEMENYARRRYEERRSKDDTLPEWEAGKIPFQEGAREKLAEVIRDRIGKAFRLEDRVPKDKIEVDTYDGVVAIDIIFEEVKRAMIHCG